MVSSTERRRTTRGNRATPTGISSRAWSA
jgi:hypothetical protein